MRIFSFLSSSCVCVFFASCACIKFKEPIFFLSFSFESVWFIWLCRRNTSIWYTFRRRNPFVFFLLIFFFHRTMQAQHATWMMWLPWCGNQISMVIYMLMLIFIFIDAEFSVFFRCFRWTHILATHSMNFRIKVLWMNKFSVLFFAPQFFGIFVIKFLQRKKTCSFTNSRTESPWACGLKCYETQLFLVVHLKWSKTLPLSTQLSHKLVN